MSEYGEVTAPATVRFERVLPGPIEEAWEYLVDSRKRGLWLARGEMERCKGGSFELFFKHSEICDDGEPMPAQFKKMENGAGYTGTVLAYDPPRLLKITWWDEGSEVTFKLAPQGENVLLTLTHEKTPNRNYRLSISSGWHAHLAVLAERMAGA
ncbi:MAG: SRPBCC family protein [Terricaulis sp.]